MNIEVLQENLSSTLNTAAKFVNPRAQLPVLANILLSTKKNMLLISATNLEVSISKAIGAKIKKSGEITVPARTITDLVSNLSKGNVSISVEKEQIKISAQNFKSTLSGMNSSDFPKVPQTLGKKFISLPKDVFLNSLSSVLFATSIDETRPVLTGVLFIFKNGQLYLVATDGFRLSQKKMKVDYKKEKKLILPKNALSELTRLTENEKQINFTFKKEDNQVIFGVGDTILTSRLIEGEFPDFEKIIPKESKLKVNLDKEEFLQAVKLASVFARDSANVVKVKIEKDAVNVFAESSQAGNQTTKLDAKIEGKGVNLDKNPLEIAFNYRFLEDLLNSIKGEDVEIKLSDSNSPGIFTDPKDKNFLHLIMPVRVQE